MSFFMVLVCMSLNIYHEARGEGYDGMAMVGLVTLNRADHDPDKVCEVVTKPYQFSWYNRVNQAKTDEEKLERLKNLVPKNNLAYINSLKVAMDVLKGKVKQRLVAMVGNADHYFNPHKASPAWKDRLRYVTTIGNHAVYSSKRPSYQVAMR